MAAKTTEGTNMPRKQRFKPSRKPKPSPSHDEAGTGRTVTSNPAENISIQERPPAQERDAPSLSGSEGGV
jgi:hypothetical protein